ncbi:hypothetical protein [Prochlorococcus sp. MIT 1303]|uniref:hypothetical protein n=1 Tax=Prochlorococcus sp. MIT 1303 TaxID=1723647 RepID=UPI001E4431D9|nr:hypothetical protein [Prochlorococcus sp. MIT 1303]
MSEDHQKHRSDSLLWSPSTGGGGKSFIGRTHFPPERRGKQAEVRIGPYSRGADTWTLKAEREEWVRIRAWSRETGKDPRELRKEEKLKV